jgi:hypothetical protein
VNWEYKVSNAPTTPRDLQAVLDRDGHEQWELVSATLIASRMMLLYKRQCQEEMVEETIGEAVSQEAPAMEEASYQVEEVAGDELAPVEGTEEEIAS